MLYHDWLLVGGFVQSSNNKCEKCVTNPLCKWVCCGWCCQGLIMGWNEAWTELKPGYIAMYRTLDDVDPICVLFFERVRPHCATLAMVPSLCHCAFVLSFDQRLSARLWQDSECTVGAGAGAVGGDSVERLIQCSTVLECCGKQHSRCFVVHTT